MRKKKKNFSILYYSREHNETRSEKCTYENEKTKEMKKKREQEEEKSKKKHITRYNTSAFVTLFSLHFTIGACERLSSLYNDRN